MPSNRAMHFLPLLLCLGTAVHAVSPADAEARLRMALQIARERNDRALVSEVETLGRRFKETLPTDADAQLSEIETKVGIDAGGWAMAGQPLFHPGPEMAVKSKMLGEQLHEAMMSGEPGRVRVVTAEMLGRV